jgi:ATP-binding cassette subfamily B protein
MAVVPNEAIRYAIDNAFPIVDGQVVGGEFRILIVAGVVILVAALVRGGFAFAQQFFGQMLSQKIAYDIRNALYNQIQRLSSAFHDKAQTGQLMSRATQDVEQSRNFAEGGLIRAVNILALVGIALYRIVDFSPKLTLIVLPFLAFLAWRAIVFQTSQRPLMLQTQQKIGELTVILQEALSGIRVVKAFSQEEQEKRKFHVPAEEVYEKQVAAQTLQAVNSPMMTISIYFAMLAVIIFGAFEVRDGRLTIGELSAFTLYLQMLAQPVRMLGFIVTMYSRASAAGERIFEVLDTESAVQDKPNAVDVGRLQGAVRFDHVSFGYDAISPVLRDVSFEAKPGEVIALLGPTGSGKTTIVSLLPRFYDVTGGGISIDGIDLRDMKMASLRRNIGMVLQDPFLFTGTIRDNILYSKPEASEEEMIAAAKAARIHDFIMSLPDEYETWVGERGITLSGGQKQRVSIARTLLLDPAILILDDATSSVDMETEYLIQQALAEVMKGRTSFIVAQRLRTIKHADQILVLRNGVLEQRGRHEELLAQDHGYYREIYELQLRGQEEDVTAGVEPRIGFST